jgi:hypothetical protein
MGWWRAGADGSSLHAEETGLVWGDGPADIMDDAIDKITDEFQAAYGRKPSRIELEAGLQFSLGVYEEQEPGSSGCPVGHQRPCAGCTWCEEKWRRRWSVPAEDVMPDAQSAISGLAQAAPGARRTSTRTNGGGAGPFPQRT